MKILKILLVLLVPSVGIVGCQKTCRKPAQPIESTSAIHQENASGDFSPAITAGRAAAPATDVEDLTPSDNVERSSNPSELDPEDKTTTVIGSGDDDREGGDKKRKK